MRRSLNACHTASRIPALPGFLVLISLIFSACTPPPQVTPTPMFVQGEATQTPFQPVNGLLPAAPTVATRLPVHATPNFTLEAVTLPAAVNPDAQPLNLAVDINPLTGLPPSDPALLERRPLAIKISNYPREIRPQYGLTLADQVFEYYIEWGDTRFIGVFYGNDARQVGPVRSGRFFDEHVARMFSAFLVFNYADPREWNYLKESDLYPYLVIPGCVDCACPPYFVSNSSNLPDERHLTNYFDITRFNECNAREGVNNSRQSIRNGFFSDLLPAGYSTQVSRIYTSYSERDYHYWEYDSVLKNYLRFQETVSIDPAAGVAAAYAPLVDAATSQQVNAENVVVLYVSHTFANKFNAEDEVYHINLLDWGHAYVFRDGIVIPALWLRPEKDQPLYLTTPEGDPIFLRPGRTFYEVIGISSTLQQDAEGWHFQFITP